MLKKKSGMALITVILVLLVLSILSMAVLSIGIAEGKNSVKSEERIKAYYIARSGADAVAAWIEDNSRDASSIIPVSPGSGEYTSTQVSLGEGNFSVKISRDSGDPSLIKIVSSSSLKNGGVKGKAVLTLKEIRGYSGGEIFSHVIFGRNIGIQGNAKIYGNIESVNNVSIKGNKNINGTITEKSKKSYPEAEIPQLPVRAYNSSGISVEGEYIIPKNADVVFNTQKNQILNIVVSTLDVDNITITGEGSVFLFIKENVKIAGNVNINSGKKKQTGESDPNSLYIIGMKGKNFEFTGNCGVNGYIYAPESVFTMRGNLDLRGAVIAGEISFGGNSDVYYDPPDTEISNQFAAFLGTSYKRINWSSN